MATLDIYSTIDGGLYCLDASYANARSGAGTTTVWGFGGNPVGQSLVIGATYWVFQSFLSFDTSSIPGIPTAAVLSTYMTAVDNTDGSFTNEARQYDWGTTLTTADWVPGASLSGQTLLATLDSSGVSTSAYNDFTDVAMVANLNRAGYTRMVVSSSQTRLNNPPTLTSNDTFSAYTEGNIAKLTVTYTPWTECINLTGNTSTYASTPAASPNRLTSDIDIRAHVSLVDWTPANPCDILTRNLPFSDYSYGFGIDTGSTGLLEFSYSTNGSSVTFVNSTVATGVADGADKWVRVTFLANNGSGGRDIKFYLSDDGGTWTQLGTTVVVAGTAALFNGSSPVFVGGDSSVVSNPLNGKIYYADVRGVISTGPVRAGFNPSDVTVTGLQTPTTWTSSSPVGETWTVSGTGWNWCSAASLAHLYGANVGAKLPTTGKVTYGAGGS